MQPSTQNIAMVLLAVSCLACSHTPPAHVISKLSPPSTAERAMEPLRRKSPGVTVPGSEVSLPTRARAGTTIEGTAPAGSRVEAGDHIVHVGESRRFELRVPEDVEGALPVRVVRPDGTVLRLRFEIIP